MNELRAYADGHWSDFTGLQGCTPADADRELGPRQHELTGGVFGGEPTQFTRYASAVSPRGVTVWVLGDVVVGLEIQQPTPPAHALDDLGRPVATLESELGGAWSQQLWPERGLVLHTRTEDGTVAVAFGLKPFTVEAWESDPLRWWRIERRRR